MPSRRDKFKAYCLAIAGALVLVAGVIGCKRTPPKTLDELYEEERKLPAVFLTTKTNQRVIAPGDSGAFVDEKTGELCWPASACLNPDCPGRESPDEPFLFVAPDPGLYVKSDGTVGYKRPEAAEIDNYYGNCPECMKIRDLKNETDADRKKFSDFVRPYVLPETAKRREELRAARQQREAELRERMKSGNE